MPVPDPSLPAFRRLQAGDRTALAELYDRFTPLLFPVVRRIVGDSVEAEDVTQQVWLQVWRRARDYDPGRGGVTAWLLAIARSRALDRSRSRATRRRAESVAGRLEGAPPVDPAAAIEQSDRNRQVRAALERIDPRERRVIELAFFGGRTQVEISKELDTPLGTVKTWTRRGLLSLRAQMGGIA